MSEINTYSVTIKVEEENLAVSMGSGSLCVLATPCVVALMENAAAALAPLGAEVTATAVLKSVDGRMFNFEVFAEDKKGEIARGTHTRVSVKSEKFQMKADSKFDE